MHVTSLLPHDNAYAPAAQPAFASDAWFCVIFHCFWTTPLSPWALRECCPIAIRPFCARKFAGSLSDLGLAAEATMIHDEQPKNPASAPVTSLYALCLSGGSLHVPEVGLRSGLVTHSEGFLLC